MRHLFRRFRKKVIVFGITGLLTLPALAGVPDGNSTVNVNVTTSTVNLSEVNSVVRDVILESLWEIVGKAERRNIWNRRKPPEF